jgi:uroporphyrinogen decarboxylase
MPAAWWNSPLMKAARREPTDRTPVWLMRQAGRYMPEYRKLRQQVPFLDLCKNAELCAEVAITTVERLGVDAAILFSDLLLVLEPMGLDLAFTQGDGPQLGNPIRTAADVDRLRELERLEPLEFVLQAVRKSRAGLPDSLPLIGFAGAPFTLAAYAIEGKASRDFRHAKALMYTDTGAWDALMGRLARAVTALLAAQIEAGVQVVQLFDSWAGCLGVDDYHRYVLPHTRSVIEALPAEVPVIHFATGNPALLPLMGEAFGKCGESFGRQVAHRPTAEEGRETKATRSVAASKQPRHAIVGVDWRTRLDEAWQSIGYDKAIQGNLDPVVLLAEPVEIRRRVKETLWQAGRRPGHIFNLGHGVLPQTPVEHVVAMVEAVRELSSR